MDYTKRFAETFLCDAIRLAQYLGGDGARLSDGIGHSADFPLAPKMKDMIGDDIRFIRVEGNDYYEVGFVTDETPTLEDTKIRNKSLYRVMVGREINKARNEIGMSIEELARLTSLREHSLIRIEEGRWDIDIALLGVILNAMQKSIKIV